MEKNISYLNRDFLDYKQALIDFAKKYYPNIAVDLDDASIGSFLIDLVASMGDNLSYHIDRSLSETNLISAQEKSSLMAIARSNGLKIPGPKGAMTEAEFTCELPLGSGGEEPNWDYAPIIKKGTKLSSGTQIFEVMSDINFGEQFDDDGVSNRKIEPIRNPNGLITKYKISKLSVVVAGESKVYTKVLSGDNIIPFMEIMLSDEKVMSVESIIIKDGGDFKVDPLISEFNYEAEFIPKELTPSKTNIYRYFEVDSLAQQYIWSPKIGNEGKAVKYEYLEKLSDKNEFIKTNSVTLGEWKPIRQKFITEFTDKGFLKIIFGAGMQQGLEDIDISNASDFAKNQITRMIANNSLGVLPNAGQTMYILYRVGGGVASNIAANTLNNIVYLNVEMNKKCSTDKNELNVIANVKNSIKVTNIIPSVSGKDMPSENEIRNLIKYNNGSNNRCVTIKDYYDRITKLPPKYGTPFRMGVMEENNKVMAYLLGVDYNGYLVSMLPSALVTNIENYLSEYKMINDFVEIKSGKIINLSIEVDLYINKNYDKSDVVLNTIKKIKDYMNINNLQMGDDIYVSDIEMELSKIDGVINLIDLRVYNEFGNGYSPIQSTQPPYYPTECDDNEGGGAVVMKDKFQIDLKASDGILYSDSQTMFEIKYDKDIRIRVKTR